MKEAHDLSNLETSLGYVFQSKSLLRMALTHSSHGGRQGNNERLEFLGDRVLNLVIAQALYTLFPEEKEGPLAKRHAALVQGTLATRIAQEIHLGDFLILSESERSSGGHQNENILADAIEAVIGALFLEAGLIQAEQVILKLWAPYLSSGEPILQDPKTTLQELVQSRGLPLPAYRIVDRSGPDHAPSFRIELIVQGFEPIHAQGPSRRSAEKAAAISFLNTLKDSRS